QLRGRQAQGHRRPLRRGEGSARRLLDDPGPLEGRGDRVGQALPRRAERGDRDPPGPGDGRFPGRCAEGGRGLRSDAEEPVGAQGDDMSTTLDPYLFFDGTCAEAMRFYEKALGGKLEMMMTQADAPPDAGVPPGSPERIMHASLALGDRRIMASDT